MNNDQLFDQLADEAAACAVCERMRERKAVLSRLNGALTPRVMFIAEAPGRNGADRTRIPFHGDTSGRNFEALLSSIELSREEIFITNTVLCSPRKPSGANDKPSRSEIRNCSVFLRRQIELINPPVIATLGAVALDALKFVEAHDFQLRDDAAKILRWNGRLLVPLYHPSPQVIITVRPLDQQKRDFRSILRAIKTRERGTRG
ncbi:MAG TPA: uracil-DNA glycosylase [Blastocatellia bacterium]|jgi:DNA polymerase|nr:uracil-DNA glycosylase [Blastocatellia bacterium]